MPQPKPRAAPAPVPETDPAVAALRHQVTDHAARLRQLENAERDRLAKRMKPADRQALGQLLERIFAERRGTPFLASEVAKLAPSLSQKKIGRLLLRGVGVYCGSYTVARLGKANGNRVLWMVTFTE